MKQDKIIILGAVAVVGVAALMLSSKRPAAAKAGGGALASSGSLALDWSGTGGGFNYLFGSGIAPDGAYYINGKKFMEAPLIFSGGDQ